MAIEKVVRVKSEGFDKLIKQTADLQKAEELLNKELAQLEKGTESYVRKQLELTETQSKLTKSTEQLKNSNKGVFGNLLSSFPGVEKGFKGLQAGLKGATGGANIFKVALLSTGIPIVVGALVMLFDQLKKVQPVMDLVSDTLSAMGVMVQQVFSAFSKILKGDFSGALKDVTTGMTEAIKESNRLNQAIRDLDEVERQNIVTKSETLLLLAKNKIALQDENLTTKEKLALIDEGIKASQNQLAVDLDIAKTRLKLRTEDLKLRSKGRELNDQEREELLNLQADVINLETSSLETRNRLATQRTSFLKQVETEEQRLNKERKDREIRNRDRQTALIKDDADREIQTLTDKYNDELALAKQRGDNLLLIEEQYLINLEALRKKHEMTGIEAREITIEKSVSQRKLQGEVEIKEVGNVESTITSIKADAMGERLDMATQALDLAGEIFGESKELQIASLVAGQAQATTEIISNTSIGSARAIAELGPIVGTPVAVALKVGAGLSIASLISKTAKGISEIRKAKPGGGGSSGGGGVGSVGGASVGAVAPAAPNTEASFNNQQLFGTAEEQFGSGAGKSQIRAVVVERDITDTQKRISTFEERSSLN